MEIGIAGAGLLGRLLAWSLARAGHGVSVFDPAPDALPPSQRPRAAAFTAAGMLSPLAEMDSGGPEVARLGWRSLALWCEIARVLPPQHGELFRQRGSLLLAHGSDEASARRVLSRMQGSDVAPQRLDQAELIGLEPALAPGLAAWLLPGEGQVLPQAMLSALHADASGVEWHWAQRVHTIEAGRITLADGSDRSFDLAIDVRGLGARPAGPEPQSQDWAAQLRGVRGEILWLHAPGVVLQRPLRLLHPRHRVYLVPRPGDLIVVGASEIESEDLSPVSLRSAVELLAAAHSVLPELAEARIVHMETNLRPALPDNLPRVQAEPGLLRINGLFRHGWLLAPALIDDALAMLGMALTTRSALHA